MLFFRALTQRIVLSCWLLFILMSVASAQADDVYISVAELSNKLKQPYRLTVIDMSEAGQYHRFHLPNAMWVNYTWLIPPRQGGVENSGGTAYMTTVLNKLGITAETDVVIYDSSANLNAARLYWELKKLNHKRAWLLAGGSVQWALERRPLTQDKPRNNVSKYVPDLKDWSARYTASDQDVLAAIHQSHVTLLDVRSRSEYMGDQGGTSVGHIPGAKNLEWSQLIEFDKGYQPKSPVDAMKLLQNIGITHKNQAIIVYCHSGHRAANTWANLIALGFSNVKLYDGSLQSYLIQDGSRLIRSATP